VNDVVNAVIPYMEQNYNVTTEANGRAFAGTSAFGSQANIFMFGTVASNFTINDVGRFGYYGPWSPAAQAPPITVTGQGPGPTAPAYQNPALKNLLGIEVAIGTYDLGGNAPMLTAITERQGLQNAGVPFRWYSVDGGHTWTFWRLVLRDFLTRVAFKATTTSATQVGNTLSVAVTAGTAQRAPPSGTVQLYVAGQAVGAPRWLNNGQAQLALDQVTSGQSVTVRYSGDNYYRKSTSAAVVVS
jgi:S-formylglutathione hydrolase FrmB